MKVILTLEELKNLCREWQKKLRLEHWEVAVCICRAKDMDMESVQGECKWTQSTAQAIIRLLDPIDYPDSPFEYDMEKVLVHELLHLHFCPFDPCKPGDDLENIMLERAIEHIALLLIELKRK